MTGLFQAGLLANGVLCAFWKLLAMKGDRDLSGLLRMGILPVGPHLTFQNPAAGEDDTFHLSRLQRHDCDPLSFSRLGPYVKDGD